MSNFQQSSSQNAQGNSQLNFALGGNRGNFWSEQSQEAAGGRQPNDGSNLVSFTGPHQNQLGSGTSAPQQQHYQQQSSQQMDKISQIGAKLNEQQRSHGSTLAPSGNPWTSQHAQYGQAASANPSQQSASQHCPVQLQMQPNQLIGGQTSETHLSHLKESFIQTANTFTAFYKQSQNAFNLAYQQGKQDAYEEVFMWFLSQGQNNSFKHVQSSQFMSFIRERMDSQSHEKIIANYADQKHKQQMAAKSQPEDEESLRNLMPPPDGANIKSGHQFQTQNQVNQPSGCRNESLNNHDLIVMNADQQVEQNLIGSQQVNKKVNTHLMQNLKFIDNKKRSRPQIQQQCQQSMAANTHFMGQTGNMKAMEENMMYKMKGGDEQQNQQSDNDQIMHGYNLMMGGELIHNNSTNGNDNHQRQFQRIKRRNQIQNANAHPQSSQSSSPPTSAGNGLPSGNAVIIPQQQLTSDGQSMYSNQQQNDISQQQFKF